MGRWEPNARERLVLAAVELFAEQGYDGTSVNEIAERAGLTKTTFFRHFPDKREVLFSGQEANARVLAESIAASPEKATPLESVASALDALSASFPEERRTFGRKLVAAIAVNPELRERATFKHTGLARAMADALRERGVPELTADLAAELGARAFERAFVAWVEPANSRTFADLARGALDELRTATAALG